MIQRAVSIEQLVQKERVLIIYGARRVGKTTLLKQYLSKLPTPYKWCTGDDATVQQVFNSGSLTEILRYFEGYDLIALDEAQYIKNVGVGLKLLVDNKPGVSVIVTGSSSFNIEQETGEPLTGRKRTVVLFPFTQGELRNTMNEFELQQRLEDFLLFGSYPEVHLAHTYAEKTELLIELANSYLLKDVFALTRLRGEQRFRDLLKLLAFQIGQEVSVSELATQIGVDAKTIQFYLDILEKAFVIKKLSAYSSNLRKEITGKSKYYFWDTGIRNAIISQFNRMQDRADTGQLFENFYVIERIKQLAYQRTYTNSYFWRTYQGQEIDLIEEKDGQLFPYEIKWGKNAKVKKQLFWKQHYQSAPIQIINRESYLTFLLNNR